MARIPVYEGGVSTRPIHQQGVEGRPIEGAFGGGAGLAALGQGLGRMGVALQEARDLEDMTRAKDAENDYARYMQEAMYGENGYMLAQGRHAFEGRQAFLEAAEKKRSEIASGLSAGARKQFERAAESRLLDVNKQVLIHSSSQQKEWVKESSTARAGLFAQDALNAVGNQEQVNRNIAAGLMEIREQAKLEGIPREALAVKEKAYVSGVHNDAVLKLAQNDPLAAEEYMKQVGEQLSPEDRYNLETKLEGAIEQARANRHAYEARAGEIGNFNFAPNVQAAIAKAAQKHGVPVEAMAVIAKIESGGLPNAKNPNSSAGGLYQQINSNARQYGVANRFDPEQSADGAARFMRDNQVYLRRHLGREPSIGELYLAHQQGGEGARKLLVNESARAVDIVGVQAVRLNGGRADMTAGEFADLWIRKAERLANGGGMKAELYLASIKDPRQRELALAAYEKQMAVQKQELDAANDEMMTWIDQQIIANPQLDLNELPLDIRMRLGGEGMGKLLDRQEKLLKHGAIKTDERLLRGLQEQYANNPVAFGRQDLWQYRDRFSDKDWDRIYGWKQTAITDARKAIEEGDVLGKIMRRADVYLNAAGIKTSGAEKDDERLAEFRRAMDEQLQEFYKSNNRAPHDGEIEEMVNTALLPVIIRKPRMMMWDRKDKAYLFGGRMRDDGTSVEVEGGYETIPSDRRKAIQNNLVAELGRQPTREEVYRRYFEWQTGLDLGDETMEERERKAWEREKVMRNKRGEEALLPQEIDPTIWYEMPIPAW